MDLSLTLGAADLESLCDDSQEGAGGISAHPGGAIMHQGLNLGEIQGTGEGGWFGKMSGKGWNICK